MTPLRSSVAAALLLAVAASPLGADSADLRAHVEYLASEALNGRMTGSEGASAAAGYLAEQLRSLGVTPLPGCDGFELPFEFTAGSRDGGSTITLVSGGEPRTLGGGDAVRALSFSDSASVSGAVVFAGYGLSVPEEDGFAYDSYATLDVEDKIVLVLRYVPEDVDQETRARLVRFSGLRYKASRARERGARALLVVTGPRSPNAGELVPMTFDAAVAGSGIVAASISGAVAETLFDQMEGKDLAAAQAALDDGNPHVTGFELSGVELTLKVEVVREKRTGRSVVGYLPASEPRRTEKPWVVLGAHFDHLGKGRSASSLARKGEVDGIHFGADDNASGVATLLRLVSDVRELPRHRDLVVAFWSGEELGLIGSSRFLKDEVVPPDQVAAYLNFDMVGRVNDDRLSLQAVGSSSVWPALIEQSNVPVGLDLALRDDPYLPTDTLSFNQAEVPSLDFFSGSHEDYHRPTDTAEKLNYAAMERVARLGALVAVRVANLDEAPDFVAVAPTRGQGGDRDTVRAFTGTIPDYTAEGEGLRLSGVIEGGPADEAGLQGGDVIVEFAGQTIANIYDYTYALDSVKIDVPVEVVLLRDGERIETTITPRARN